VPHRVLRKAHRERSRRQADARRLPSGQSTSLTREGHCGNRAGERHWSQGAVRAPELQCSPHHSDSALRPFIANLERRAGFKADDVQATSRQVGSGPCFHGSRIEAVAPLFAALLSIPFGSGVGGWRNGPSGTAVCACSNAVPCRPWAFFTDSLCAARGRRLRAGERRGGWGTGRVRRPTVGPVRT
jgi:hypothetical protein